MTRFWLYCLAGLLCLGSCQPVENDKPGDGGNTPADPQFVVSGAPTGPVKPYSSFILNVSSKSDGFIDFKSSNKAVATVALSGRRQYKVDTKSPAQKTEVSISFSQEADEGYAEASETVTFTVKNDGFLCCITHRQNTGTYTLPTSKIMVDNELGDITIAENPTGLVILLEVSIVNFSGGFRNRGFKLFPVL